MSEALENKKGQYFYIQCPYYPKTRSSQIFPKPQSYGYATAALASEEKLLFQFAVSVDGAKNWQQPRDRLTSKKHSNQQKYIDDFAIQGQVLGPSRNADVLNCAEVSQLKRINKKSRHNGQPRARKEVSRAMFHYYFKSGAFTVQEQARFQRSLQRVHVPPLTHSNARKLADLNRRCLLLTTQQCDYKHNATFLKGKLNAGKCHHLLIHPGEFLPRANMQSVDDFSTKQCLLVSKKADIVSIRFSNLERKTQLELDRTLDFIVSVKERLTEVTDEFEKFALSTAQFKKDYDLYCKT